MIERSPLQSLEQKRFDPDKESLRLMKELRDMLPTVQEEFPDIVGMGFFGSRTKGLNSPHSDLDLTFFTDSSNKTHRSVSSSDRTRRIRSLFKSRIWLDLARHHDDGLRERDISKEALDRELRTFIDTVNTLPPEKRIPGKWPSQIVNKAIGVIFHLAVGDAVYAARSYVLDRLKQEPQGEYYLQMLMGELAYKEREGSGAPKREEPMYLHYPRTIAEAEQHFLTIRKENEPA